MATNPKIILRRIAHLWFCLDAWDWHGGRRQRPFCWVLGSAQREAARKGGAV